jgi:hypothetical protein
MKGFLPERSKFAPVKYKTDQLVGPRFGIRSVDVIFRGNIDVEGDPARTDVLKLRQDGTDDKMVDSTHVCYVDGMAVFFLKIDGDGVEVLTKYRHEDYRQGVVCWRPLISGED